MCNTYMALERSLSYLEIFQGCSATDVLSLMDGDA
jgi:hypothetical protein